MPGLRVKTWICLRYCSSSLNWVSLSSVSVLVVNSKCFAVSSKGTLAISAIVLANLLSRLYND